MTENIIELIEFGHFCDTTLICCDGEVSAPRAVVALAYRTFYSMLMELEHVDSITLILPQFRQFEVEARIFSRISCGLKVLYIAILTLKFLPIIIMMLFILSNF